MDGAQPGILPGYNRAVDDNRPAAEEYRRRPGDEIVEPLFAALDPRDSGPEPEPRGSSADGGGQDASTEPADADRAGSAGWLGALKRWLGRADA